MTDRERVADETRTRLLTEHEAVASKVLRAAATVADTWRADWTTNRTAVVEPLRGELTTGGVLEQFPNVLQDAIQTAGYELQASPVAKPPYVIITSQGPILRAPVRDGRLVVTYQVFAVKRTTPPRYYRSGSTPRDILSVKIIQADSRE